MHYNKFIGKFTLNQGCATRGPGTGVLWPVERSRFSASITVFQRLMPNFLGGQRVVCTQSLTHAAVVRGPIWLCAVGLTELHGGTPLL